MSLGISDFDYPITTTVAHWRGQRIYCMRVHVSCETTTVPLVNVVTWIEESFAKLSFPYASQRFQVVF